MDTNKSLAFMFNCFHPKTKSSDSTDHAFKFISQKILHILNLFIFVSCSFSLHGCSFFITAMFTFFFDLFINDKIIIQSLFEYTMHHYIGIAANGRSKMTIMLESQTIVTNIFGGILCL